MTDRRSNPVAPAPANGGPAGWRRAALLAYLSAALAALGFGGALALWFTDTRETEVAWAPTLGLSLQFELDGLGLLYTLLATGIGFAVFLYSARYLPLHLAHQERPPRDATRFYGFLVLFMVAMIGLATARDLILLFVFWDLTAVASYFLIGYDRQEAESRSAALMALLVTGVTAMFLLVASVMLYVAYGTFSLPQLAERAQPGLLLTGAGALVLVAGLAKAAQFPFHFWLPRAMAAPTPVSAYLHSAAMVAAGVFLVGRFYPLLEQSRVLLDVMLGVGFGSIAVGGVLALTRDRLKQVLAYSTVSQYGYVVAMYGLGGEVGAGAAAFYVLAHALAKSALFLTAGAVTEATGEDRLSRLGGLARRLPALAAGSLVAAAGLAALPLTIGFFKDELFFEAALEHPWPYALLATLAAGLTFGYIGRFWAGIFLGRRSARVTGAPALLVLPVLGLAAVVVAGGIAVEPFARLASDAAEASLDAAASVAPSYHLDASAENLLALAAYLVGALLLATERTWRAPALAAARLGAALGPERLYQLSLAWLNRLSDLVHWIEVRDLRTRIAAVLIPGGALLLAGLVATPTTGYVVGSVSSDDVSLVLVLAVVVVAALASTVPRGHLTMVLVVSSVGYALAVAYAFMGGPNVALVAVLIETVIAVLFLGAFALLPRSALQRLSSLRTGSRRRWRDPLIAIAAGAAAFLVVWGVLSRPSVAESVAAEHLRLAPDAHAKDVVTAILADFRGLDTLGEITVVGIALLGSVILFARRRVP